QTTAAGFPRTMLPLPSRYLPAPFSLTASVLQCGISSSVIFSIPYSFCQKLIIPAPTLPDSPTGPILSFGPGLTSCSPSDGPGPIPTRSDPCSDVRNNNAQRPHIPAGSAHPSLPGWPA